MNTKNDFENLIGLIPSAEFLKINTELKDLMKSFIKINTSKKER